MEDQMRMEGVQTVKDRLDAAYKLADNAQELIEVLQAAIAEK